jgi:hypothetical protein
MKGSGIKKCEVHFLDEAVFNQSNTVVVGWVFLGCLLLCTSVSILAITKRWTKVLLDKHAKYEIPTL